MRRAWVALASISINAFAADASLERAQQLLSDLKYREAAAALDAAWKAPGNSREEVLTILQLQGIVAASIGQGLQAREAFTALLTLDPSRRLPADLPPKVMTFFYEARGRVDERGPLEVTAAPPAAHGGALQLAIVVKDPIALAVTARFHLQPAGGPWTTVSVPLQKGRATAEVKASSAKWWLELLNAQSGVLLALGAEAEPLLAGTAPSTPQSPVSAVTPEAPGGLTVSVRHPWRPYSYVALGVGVACLIAGVALGVRSASLLDQVKSLPVDGQGKVVGYTQQQGYDLDSQQRTFAALANVCYVAGGVLAAAGLGLFFFGPEDSALALVPSGPGFALAGTF